ncbi:MAG TPA: contractile injection system tape measure protein [Propionicimonas sp.]|nr:contractile injection system tape measure protein [Propionicimonas sp.]
MAGSADVTIRRQVLEVELHGSAAEGHALQRRLPQVCSEVVSPAIEAALGALDPGDSFLFLDQLSIDLSLGSLDGFEAELAAAVRREIAEHFRRHPLRPTGAAQAAPEAGGVSQRTPAETVEDALVAFLRTGRLPWSFRLPPDRTVEQLVREAWREAGGHHDPPAATLRRLRDVLGAPLCRERLVLQFTPGFVMTLLRGLSPGVAADVERVAAVLGEPDPATPAGRRFAIRVREAGLEAAVAGRTLAPAALAASAWTAIGPRHREDRPLRAALERAWPGSTRTDEPPAPGSVRIDEPPAPGAPPGRSDARSAPSAADANEPGGGLLVDNAGLVLLHPFLTRFLGGLGVAVGDELVDPDRALALLHHLATGELAAPEHQVTLAKVLCGVPSDRPSAADVGLTPAETAEATALLTAAIGHWDALRGTSPDALRAEFLQRRGVLAETPDGDWLLRVEARTVDILLDQLPWGLSSFRLPWMHRLMMVEWQ